jgi:NAD(P)-dependent dehydrogenase (short-subunit alcohol dehydrogenase family)
MSSARPLAIVTGAGSGIGRATALRLVADGYEVVALDRDKPSLDELVGEHPTVMSAWVADLAQLDGIEEFFEDLLGTLGTPAVVVNAAGIALVATVLDEDLAAWQRVIDINLTAPMLICRSVLPAMIDNGGGVIVNVASTAAFRGVRGRAAYCSAKAGLVGLTRAIAADFAKDGIRINAICPGTVDTGYTKAVLAVAEDPEATREFMTQRQLIGRMGTPEEVADTIAFMVSPQASFLHGSSIVLDGGRSVL